jgi:hypothetical protein
MDFASLLKKKKNKKKRPASTVASQGPDAKRQHVSEQPKVRKVTKTVTIFFAHVPKTAGSAIKQILKQSCIPTHQGEGWKIRTKDGKTVHIIARGHAYSSDFPRSAFKVATIREPVERFLSAFSFVREAGINHPHQQAVSQAREWSPFLQKFGSVAEFLKDQAAVKTIMHPTSGHTHFHHLRSWIMDPQTKALNVDFIIRQTNVNEDFARLCSLLQLEVSQNVAPFNVTGKKFEVTKEDRLTIEQLLADDIQIYNDVSATLDSLHSSAEQKIAALLGSSGSSISNTGHELHIEATANVSQHFWHFMMGEFLPIVYEIITAPKSIRKVFIYKEQAQFPLNSFYHELCHTHGTGTGGSSIPEISVVEPKGKPKNAHVTYHESWDFVGGGEKLKQVGRYLAQWAASANAGQDKDGGDVTVVQIRKNVESLSAYYSQHAHGVGKGGTKRYGTDKRNVSNLPEVAAEIEKAYTVGDGGGAGGSKSKSNRERRRVQEVADDGQTLLQQIRTYAQADVLVLGHGAGMVHMLWMKQNSTIVEIIPTAKVREGTGAADGALRLSGLLNHNLHRIECDDSHQSIEPTRVIDAVKQHRQLRAGGAGSSGGSAGGSGGDSTHVGGGGGGGGGGGDGKPAITTLVLTASSSQPAPEPVAGAGAGAGAASGNLTNTNMNTDTNTHAAAATTTPTIGSGGADKELPAVAEEFRSMVIGNLVALRERELTDADADVDMDARHGVGRVVFEQMTHSQVQ